MILKRLLIELKLPDSYAAMNFDRIMNALSDPRIKKMETKEKNALQYIKNFASRIGAGNGRYAHMDGNNMAKLQSIISLYLYNDIDYNEAKKEYDNIIDSMIKRVRK